MERINEPAIASYSEGIDILDVMRAHGVSLTPYGDGSRLQGKCPFCYPAPQKQELIVSPSVGMYKCPACGAYGNVFDFVSRIEGITYSQAARKLKLHKADEPNPSKEIYLAIHKDACEWFQKQLYGKGGKGALTYLREQRQLSDVTIKRFRLGYGGNSSTALYRHLQQKYSAQLLEKSGLFVFAEKGVFDRFKGRVMFPITDREGHVIAFGGRILDDTLETAKYLNSPESEFFHKGEHLYAEDFAKNSRRDYVLLAEGYMDVIALHQAGFDNAVASLGTSLTSKQSRLVAKLSDTAVISYDSDAPGEKAAQRAIPILRSADTKTKWFSMLPAKDPDEYIKTFGKAAYEKLIERAIELTVDKDGNLKKI